MFKTQLQSGLSLGIIGQPLTHSLSPLLHAQIMQAMGINGVYQKYEVPAEELPNVVHRLGLKGLRGLNVTIPHKVRVMAEMDWLSPEAELAGAVNTIVFESRDSASGTVQKKGYNTDIAGFIRSLPNHVVERLPESEVLMLGAGGAARAVLTALIQLQVGSVTIAVRDPEKAVSLVSDAEIMKQTYRQNMEIRLVSLLSLPSLESFGGVINTTPLGMWPDLNFSPIDSTQLETLPAGALVYDLIYRPAETLLLKDAQRLGLHSVNGLDMLIYQGICAFELWQEKPFPESLLPVLRKQLFQAMGSTSA